MQALRRHVPKVIAQIIGQYAAFKWCWIDGLHGDVGPRGCCCAKCWVCDRAARRPNKQGMKMFIGIRDPATWRYSQYTKLWICSNACFVRLNLRGVSSIYIAHKDGLMYEDHHSIGAAGIVLHARTPKHMHETARYIGEHIEGVRWRYLHTPWDLLPAWCPTRHTLPAMILMDANELRWNDVHQNNNANCDYLLRTAIDA